MRTELEFQHKLLRLEALRLKILIINLIKFPYYFCLYFGIVSYRATPVIVSAGNTIFKSYLVGFDTLGSIIPIK